MCFLVYFLYEEELKQRWLRCGGVVACEADVEKSWLMVEREAISADGGAT
jgi:hypothetical protein